METCSDKPPALSAGSRSPKGIGLVPDIKQPQPEQPCLSLPPPSKKTDEVHRASLSSTKFKTPLDHAQMLGHQIGRSLTVAGFERSKDLFVVIISAVRHIWRPKNADDP